MSKVWRHKFKMDKDGKAFRTTTEPPEAEKKFWVEVKGHLVQIDRGDAIKKNKEEQLIERDIHFRYYEFTLPNGRKVYLTNRPDVCVPSTVEDFLKQKSPKVRFQLTDDKVEFFNMDYVPFHWLTWIPGWNPPLENVFVFISLMLKYDGEPDTEPIWIHCDSSSMRAPTFFGLFCHVAYPGWIDSICDGVVTSDGQPYQSSPARYANINFTMQPESKILITRWIAKGERGAHHFLVNEAQGLQKEKV